jgi:hypothetical protein
VASCNSSRRIRKSDLHVDPGPLPGWEKADQRVPTAGDRVFCTEGEAEVSKVCWRTSDGGRVLELRILDRAAPPFYAAASNVLVRKRSA